MAIAGTVALSLFFPWAAELVAEMGPRHDDHLWAERYAGHRLCRRA